MKMMEVPACAVCPARVQLNGLTVCNATHTVINDSGIFPTDCPLNDEADRRAARYRSAKEIGNLLGVSIGCVVESVKSAGLPCMRMGTRYIFDEDEVLSWLKSRSSGGVK